MRTPTDPKITKANQPVKPMSEHLFLTRDSAMTSAPAEVEDSSDLNDIEKLIWHSSEDELGVLLANWMATPVIKESRIWDICIPGTHNSCAYDIASSEVNRPGFQFASLFIKCQDKSVMEQLTDGVRFLDLRVCKNIQNLGEPFCAHGGYKTVPLISAFREISEFLSIHHSEIIILSLRKDLGFIIGPGAMTLYESDMWVTLYLGQFLGPRLGVDTKMQELVER